MFIHRIGLALVVDGHGCGYNIGVLQYFHVSNQVGSSLDTDFLYIRSQESLQQLCEQLEKESLISFDTEFVAEDSYRPLLCLLQVATENHIAIIDPLEIDDLSVFWNLLKRLYG